LEEFVPKQIENNSHMPSSTDVVENGVVAHIIDENALSMHTNTGDALVELRKFSAVWDLPVN
jgi:hypothetical protein